jgi:glycosyltransferase involved in cell wall biosynthesis
VRTCALAEALAHRGRKVDLVLADGRGAVLEQVADSVRVVDLGSKRTATALPRLVRYLIRARPHVLVAAKDHANVTAVGSARLVRGTRVVATVRAQPSAALAHPERWTGHVVRRLLPVVYPRADAIVAVSHGVANDLRELAPASAHVLRVIANPVVSAPFLEAAAQAPTHPWFAPDRNHKVIVWCGRLSEEKDPLAAVDAFSRLERKDCRLLFVGDGPLRAAVASRASAAGVGEVVGFTGFVSNAPSYIKAADALVLSSRREGLPGVLIEALALGTPIVSTDCASGPNEILDQGRLGELVPVGDTSALARGMEDALASGRRVPNASDVEPYTQDGAARRYEALFHDLGLPVSDE